MLHQPIEQLSVSVQRVHVMRLLVVTTRLTAGAKLRLPRARTRDPGPRERGRSVLLAVHAQAVQASTPLPAPAHGICERPDHLFGAGECQEDEEPLQGVEGDECVPEALDVEVTGDEPHCPGEPHDEGQPDVEAEVPLRAAAGGEARRGGRREDHVRARGEEGDVEQHDQRQGHREEHQQGVAVAEPAALHPEARPEV